MEAMIMLNRQEIAKLIQEKELVSGYINLDVQIAPNGFDFTAGSVMEFSGPGALDFSNKERIIPQPREIRAEKISPQDKFGWWNLKKGAYKIRTNESVSLPRDLVMIAYPRSSLLRMGAFTQNAVWDAGFRGKSEFILVVDNPHGLKLKQNARIIQGVFIKINETDVGYQGIYQEQGGKG